MALAIRGKAASPTNTKVMVMPGELLGSWIDRVPFSISLPKFEWLSTLPSLCHLQSPISTNVKQYWASHTPSKTIL